MGKISWLKNSLKTKEFINRIKITIMKINLKSFFNIQSLAILILLFLPVLLHAEPSDPGSDPDVPIDGGLSVLLAAGVGYGVRELKKKRLNQK